MQKHVNSDKSKKEGWFARRRGKKEAIAVYERIKGKLDEKGLEEYKALTPEQKGVVREKLSGDILHTKAVADTKKDYKELLALLQFAATTGKTTDWGEDEIDIKLTEALVEVFDNSEYTEPGAVGSARMAVQALWNNNYYHGEFWETLLEHNDPMINAFVIHNMTITEGGDEVLMKNQDKLAAKMNLTDVGRKFLLKNFDELAAETRQQILGMLSTNGMPMDMTPILPKMIEYPELRVPMMAWMIRGININATHAAMKPELLQKMVQAAAKDIQMQMGKTLTKIHELIEDAVGLERVLIAALYRNFKINGEVNLGEEELGFVKKIILSPADHPKIREICAGMLVENESAEAKKMQEEAITEGAELFDDADVKAQTKGYDIVRLMATVGSSYAKEILESMRDEALEDIKDKNASKEQKELALKIVNDSAGLLE